MSAPVRTTSSPFFFVLLYKCFMKLLCHVALVPYSVYHGVLSGAGDEFIALQDLSFSFHPKERKDEMKTWASTLERECREIQKIDNRENLSGGGK